MQFIAGDFNVCLDNNIDVYSSNINDFLLRHSLSRCDDLFPQAKVATYANVTSCRPGPILSISTISFVLHAKVAEEIHLQMCIYGQLSEVQMVRDLDVDLGLGQGHINIHSTYRTTSMPKHVTVASRTMEIRPFEFREISTNGEV